MGTCLIVNDTYLFVVVVTDEVNAVGSSTYGCCDAKRPNRHLPGDVLFQTKDGERSKAEVDGYKLSDVVDDVLAVDDSQPSLWRIIGELLCKSLVNSSFNVDSAFEQPLKVGSKNSGTLLHQPLVQYLGRIVKDVAEDAIVDDPVFCVVGFAQPFYITEVELQRATHVAVDGCWREQRAV